MKPINVTCLKKSFMFTFILGFLAYGYVFVNYTPSHDGMMIVKTNQWWEMSVGRFVVMYYAPIRGYLESPWLIGLLTMTYTALAVYLTINMLGIKDDNRRVFVVSAVYVLNIAYISNSCVYIFCWDLLALALLASVYAAYLIIRYDRLWAYAVAALMIALSLGMYQSYITVTFGLFLIAICKWLIDDESIQNIARRFGLFCATMPVSAVFYLALVKITQKLNDVQPYEGAYESVTNLRSLRIGNIIKTIPVCYKQVAKHFVSAATYDSIAFRYINVLLFFVGAFLWVSFFINWKPKTTKKSLAIVIIVIAVLVFPLGINAVSLLMEGSIYHMMVFSYQLVYIIALYPALYSMETFDIPKSGRSVHPMMTIVALIACISFCVVRYSNDILYYQKLVGEGTSSAIDGIIYDMERNAEFDKDQTPIVIVGDVGSSIGENYEFRGTYANTGGMTALGSTVTYNQCLAWYTRYVLGKEYVWNSPDADELQNNPEVVAMPIYPHEGYCKVVDGNMVIKFE